MVVGSYKNIILNIKVSYFIHPYAFDFNLQANDINLWPPFSVTITPVNNTQSCSISSNHCDTATYAAGMLPVYCLPTQSTPSVDPQMASGYQGKQYTANFISLSAKILFV